MKPSWVAVDVETTGLNPWHGDRVFSAAWTTEHGEQGFVRWHVNPLTRQVDYKAIENEEGGGVKKLISLCVDPSISKVFHNAKFDLRMLSFAGISVAGKIEDTMIAMFVLRNDMSSYRLKYLGEKLLGVSKGDENDLKESTQKERKAAKKIGYAIHEDVEADYWLAKPELEKRYNIQDTYRTALLWKFLGTKLRTTKLWDVYLREMKLFPVTYSMEARGVRLDTDMVRKEIHNHEKLANEALAELNKVAGKEVNFNSPAQVADLFYNKLGMPVVEKTDKGAPSVGKKMLFKLRDKYPILKTYERYNASCHALENFFKKYDYLKVKEGDYYTIHPNFIQTGARTGRYACRTPNLQNAANDYAHHVVTSFGARSPFGPRPGYTWYLYDYAQIELRIFSVLSKEPRLLSAIQAGRDVMTEVANHVWGKGRDIVKEEESKFGRSDTRARAKCLMYGRIYGIGVGGAVNLLRCTRDEAATYLNEFAEAFPGIDTFMEQYSRNAAITGYITNVYGRRLYVESDQAYKSVNYLVQSTAADFLKGRMIAIHNYFKDNKLDAHLVMSIHDELAFEIRNTLATTTLLKKIKSIMEDHEGKFPELPCLKTEAKKVVSRWDQKEKVCLP